MTGLLETVSAYGLTFLVPSGDTGVGACLRDFGEFARVETDLIAALVGDGTYVDVGANLGSIALPVAKRGVPTIALEANRYFAQVLAANALNNGIFNIEVLHAAAGEVRRIADFPVVPLKQRGNLGISGFGLMGKFPAEPTLMLPLDTVVDGRVTVIKVDVEGYELGVLEGATHLLQQTRPVWIVESSGDTVANRNVISRFVEADYCLYWLYAPFVTPQSERSGPAEMRAKGDINILAMPRGQVPPWDILPVQDDPVWPGHVRQFPYLKRFGFDV